MAVLHFVEGSSLSIILPKRYGCIISDPAWRFGNTTSNGAAEQHYTPDEKTERATMPTEDILQLPVSQLALPDAHLFLWTTAGHTDIALDLMRFWDFTFKCAIVWVKTNDLVTRLHPDGRFHHHFTIKAMNELLAADAVVEGEVVATEESRSAAEFKLDYVDARIKTAFGPGNYFRHATELCLFGARGSSVGRVRNITNVVFAPRTENHSEKPKIIHEIAEVLSPAPYLEMFARDQYDAHWDVWGNEPEIAHLSINLGAYGWQPPNP